MEILRLNFNNEYNKQAENQIGFEIPGTIPYWLSDNPEYRIVLSKKLRDLADRCDKKEFPFEEKEKLTVFGKITC